MSLLINNKEFSTIHFTGILGSGMSAIAQYLRWTGVSVSGSDRLLNSEDTAIIKNKLTDLECRLFSQDGTGINEATDAICISTAIEESNPDIVAARQYNKPIFHRSDILAAIVSSKKTIAIAGTSGKSTVTAMVFEFLTASGKAPSLISGASLRRLENEGLIGNAYYGKSEYLVIEADESDGTLVKYYPSISVILNVSKDHKTIPELLELFSTFSKNSSVTIVNADDTWLASIGSAKTFGVYNNASYTPDSYQLDKLSCTIKRKGLTFSLPLPGAHNMSNLCAALAVCELTECDPLLLCGAVSGYQGVARRFTIYKTDKKIYVVDDFAHNPEKIKAAVNAARNLSSRVIAIYQPHGFGPTRFLKDDYIEAFRSVFKKGDILYLLPIYYAGGTAQKDISSDILINALGDISFTACAPQTRDELIKLVKQNASENDCVLLMGARDPSLAAFARTITDQLGGIEHNS